MNLATLLTVKRIVAEVLGHDADTLNPDERLSDLGADEIDVVEIDLMLDDEFGYGSDQDVVDQHINENATCTSMAVWLDSLS